MKFNMNDILQQAQKMQADLEKVKTEMERKTVTGESGGGMVSVVMTCSNKVISINIAKELVNTDEKEMLEDLIVAAVNNASQKAGETAAEEMRKVSPMMPNMPGFGF